MASQEPADAGRRREVGGPSIVQFVVVIGLIVVIAMLALVVMGGQVSQNLGRIGDSV